MYRTSPIAWLVVLRINTRCVWQGEAETEALLGELEQLLQENEDLVYRHEWKDGDFLITDNLALAHEATPETQLPVSQVGLRILHRTTVAGVHVPSK